jgi:cytidine deaminase
MNELNSGAGLQIRLPGAKPATLADHLPDVFGQKDLGIARLLMDQNNYSYQLSLTDELEQAALLAANKSYCCTATVHSFLAVAAVARCMRAAMLKTPPITQVCRRCRSH